MVSMVVAEIVLVARAPQAQEFSKFYEIMRNFILHCVFNCSLTISNGMKAANSRNVLFN